MNLGTTESSGTIDETDFVKEFRPLRHQLRIIPIYIDNDIC